MRQGQKGNRPYRGKKNREERKKKHRDRAEAEGKQMREIGESIKFDYWGWEKTDLTPFLFIRVYFKVPAIPAEFEAEVEDVLREVFHEHL